MDTSTPVIVATGLRLSTRRGAVFGPIDLQVSGGEYVVFAGPGGSGKTALLLALVGRLRLTTGTLRVAGVDAIRHPAAVRRVCALAVFAGVNDLPGALSVRDAITAELHLWRVSGRFADVAALAATVGLDGVLGTAVDDLTDLQRASLGVGLALVPRPAVIAVDEIGGGLTRDEQSAFDALLRSVASDGVTVLGSCVDPRAAALADRIIPMLHLTESEAAHARTEAR